MRRILSALAVTAMVVFQGCSDKEDHDSDSSPAAITRGCIQGVLINGLTGERIGLPAATDRAGVHVLVRGQMLSYTPVLTGAADPATGNPNIVGEYTLCDIPLDDQFPVFAWVDGFLPYESHVTVRSTAASLSGQAELDIVKPVPTELVNIRLYPVGVQTKDVKVTVLQNAVPVVGAEVHLKPLGGNYLDPLTNFLAPVNTRQVPLKVATNDQGFALFPAASLVIGGHYTYTVLPPDGGSAQDAVAGTLTIGLRGPQSTDDPYDFYIKIGHAAGDLRVVSSSLELSNFSPTGEVKYIFNRPVELVPGTADSIVAQLNNANGAALKTNTSGNNKTEQVAVGITENVVTLTPQFKTAPKVDKEPGLSVTMSGIKVRPVNSPGTASSLALDPTVSIFGGAAVPRVATSFEVVGTDTRSATIDTDASPDLTVRVLDQFGSPFTSGAAAITMTITDTPGGATGQQLDHDGNTGTTVSALPDGAGSMAATFRVGNTAGTYEVTASYGSLTDIVFTITGTP